MAFIKTLLRNQRGAAALEMGLILAMIVIAIFAAMSSLGNEATNSFNATANKVMSATR